MTLQRNSESENSCLVVCGYETNFPCFINFPVFHHYLNIRYLYITLKFDTSLQLSFDDTF